MMPKLSVKFDPPICPQCGEPVIYRPCGPTHAVMQVRCIHDYARACVEAAAAICESRRVNKSPDYFPGTIYDGACNDCAAAIREAAKEIE